MKSDLTVGDTCIRYLASALYLLSRLHSQIRINPSVQQSVPLGCFQVQDVYFFLPLYMAIGTFILFGFAQMSNDLLRGIWM